MLENKVDDELWNVEKNVGQKLERGYFMRLEINGIIYGIVELNLLFRWQNEKYYKTNKYYNIIIIYRLKVE